MMKFKFILICLLLTTIFTIIFFGAKESELAQDFIRGLQHTKDNILVTEEIIPSDIGRILWEYGMRSDLDGLKVYNNGEKEYFTFQDHSGTVNSGKVWNLFVINSTPFFKKYTEIDAMMSIWLYVIEHDIPYDLVGIAYDYKADGFVATNEIHISKEQFLEFYKLANVGELNRKQKIKRLAKLWIEKVHYSRQPWLIDIKDMNK